MEVKFTGTLNHNQNKTKTKGQIFNSGKDVSKDAGIYATLNEYLYLLTFEIMLMLRLVARKQSKTKYFRDFLLSVLHVQRNTLLASI